MEAVALAVIACMLRAVQLIVGSVKVGEEEPVLW